MCGIAGMMTRDGSAPPAALLKAMETALEHRGPDGNGHYRVGDVGMVHTRLAIIDAATGDQPLYESGGAALIADGKVYNHLELRSTLAGVAFSTASDCELPLHLYRRHGLDFPRHLRGMYAIALHDPLQQRLILARDPFGIKPLYYVDLPQGIAFASEPRALMAAGLVQAATTKQARNELLQLQFTIGRETIFAGIERVLPGELVVIAQGRIVERHRREALPAESPRRISEDEALVQLDAVLTDSVTVHRRSDVPCGLFLSGGIDSATLLAMMARLNERPVKTFTVGFEDPALADERPLARRLAQSVGAEHVEVAFSEADFWRLLPALAAALDDPTADYAVLPTFKLGWAARQAGLKVVLSGEGGNELFGGYGRYRSLRRPWWLGGRLPRARGTLDRLGILEGDLAGWRDGIAAAELRAAAGGRTRLQVAQAVDCADWLPNDLLTKLDRGLMAWGVEGRTPFLDPAVADFAFRLPDELKIRKRLGKWLLRRWLGQHLPASEPFTRKKGFTVPVGRWIARRGGEIGRLVARRPVIAELCRPAAVEKLFLAADEKHEGFAAWTLLFYALWHRHHIEGAPFPEDTFAALA